MQYFSPWGWHSCMHSVPVGSVPVPVSIHLPSAGTHVCPGFSCVVILPFLHWFSSHPLYVSAHSVVLLGWFPQFPGSPQIPGELPPPPEPPQFMLILQVSDALSQHSRGFGHCESLVQATTMGRPAINASKTKQNNIFFIISSFNAVALKLFPL